MKNLPYVPKQGDLVFLTFDPQAGHEQKGRRPALVVSKELFNRHTGFAIVCPITNTFRDFPFHLQVPESSKITGYIMTEQVKSVDYNSRRIQFVQAAPWETLQEVLSLLDAVFF